MQYSTLYEHLVHYNTYMDLNASSNTQSDSAQSAFLLGIGTRVKSFRALRGMSRRILAESSAVSERYLAVLETGKGNISILRLRQIANAMGIRIEDLLSEPTGSAEYTYLLQYLRDADSAEVVRLYRELAQRRPTSPLLIALIGLRGAGKSTIGAALAERLGWSFTELVRTIEQHAGMKVNEIFSLGGQSTYRRFERQCLEESIESSNRGIIAAGGSLVSEPSSYERLLSSCVTIWLRASPEDHMNRVIAQGDSRPMAGNSRAMDDLKRILNERENLYRRADYIVETSGTSIVNTVNEIVGLPAVAEIAIAKGVA